MEKEFTLNEIEGLYNYITNNWDNYTKDIKLNMKSLYNLVCLKKKLEELHNKNQDTLLIIFKNNGAIQGEDGSLRIPDQNIKKASNELEELGNQKVTLQFDKILVKETDNMPTNLFEKLFEFIEIQ